MDSTVYRFTRQGHPSKQWAEWFNGLTISLARNGETVLTGPAANQAALHGLLRNVRDVGMPLVAVMGVGSGALDEQMNVP